MILTDEEIKRLYKLENIEEALIVTPLLDEEEQINDCAIDLRLGFNFSVSIHTRFSCIDWTNQSQPADTFLQKTYRDFGERFLLYPGQLVLAHSFEYVKLPNNIFGTVATRSSWHRVGLSINGVVQPGYRGSISMELYNHSQVPIALYPGMRIVQLILQTTSGTNEGYQARSTAKYIANIENQATAISNDKEIQKLLNFSR